MNRGMIIVYAILFHVAFAWAATAAKPQYNLPFTIKVQANTILPTEVAIGSTVHAIYQITNNNAIPAIGASIVSLPANTSISPTGCGAGATFNLNPGASCTLTLIVSPNGLLVNQQINGLNPPLMACWNDGVSCAGTTDILQVTVIPPPSLTYQSLMQDVLIDADLWGGDAPAMLSANYGFQGIEGVPGYEAAVIAAGGAWETITTPDASYAAYTSSETPQTVAIAFGYPTNHADAMPICFNWPVLPTTVNPSNFRLTLNTGEIVRPEVASISPNLLYNKRSCVVIFGKFGNRLAPGTVGAIYPVTVSIVDNGTTMMLYGPNGPVSAVGLSIASGNPYQMGGGPKLIGAKLSAYPIQGQCAPTAFNTNFPNGGDALYPGAAQFRLRIYTTAGISPDGVAAILPNTFRNYFQVQAMYNGSTITLVETNTPYTVDGGTITILGLADLAAACTPCNDAYVADRDNYLDIVLEGPEAAMRSIVAVIIPASGDNYQPLYNPGGPGNNPTPGVTYTYPGPYWYQPVTLDLDAPYQRVTYNPNAIACPPQPPSCEFPACAT